MNVIYIDHYTFNCAHGIDTCLHVMTIDVNTFYAWPLLFDHDYLCILNAK